MDRLIFHIDVNSAFLSWEAAKRVANGEPDIRLIPSAVGRDGDKRTGVILAKSIPAKKYGITTGEPVAMALRKCPKLVLVKPDTALYERSSKAFIKVCKKYAPVVEQYSIDECFLDMTGTHNIYPDPIALAYKIKDEIKDTLGFTVNVGIGSNKMLAKMAGDFEKPDKVHTLFTNEIQNKMWPMSVKDLLLVGKSTAEKLERSYIKTIGELANADLKRIQLIVGNKLGEKIYEYAHGIDDTPVLEKPEELKGYSNSVTLEEDVKTKEAAYKVLLSIVDHVSRRMRQDEVKAYCISVTIRGNDFKDHSHQRKLMEATDISNEIYDVVKELFEELWDGYTPLRLLGVALTNLTKDDVVQFALFDDKDKEKQRKLDKALDKLKDKYGDGSIIRGRQI